MSLNAFVILQMIIRYCMNTMRYFTVKSMTRAGMFDIMGGDPFVRKSPMRLYLDGIGVNNNAVATPCLFSAVYYAALPQVSPPVHWFLHCATVALRTVLDHNIRVNEAEISLWGLEWRWEDVTAGWVTMLMFPMVLAVLDRRGFWSLVPAPFRRALEKARRGRIAQRVRAMTETSELWRKPHDA